MQLILILIFVIHFLIFKNKYDFYIICLILLCYFLKPKPINENYINFDPDALKEKLFKVNSIDEIKNKNINEFVNNKNDELNKKKNKLLLIINKINTTIEELLNSSLLKINTIRDKINLIFSVIIVSFKILFNLNKKFKDFNEIVNLLKILFEYTINELKLIDESYQKIKKDWDKCFETNSLSRYVGFNTNCEKAFKKTIKLKREIIDLPLKIQEKFNSLNFKNFDIKDLNELLNNNKSVFKNCINTFDKNRENINIDFKKTIKELEKENDNINII